MKSRLYLQLGRAGDILNVLPLLRRDFLATGVKPSIIIGKEFSRLFEGITYAEPIVWGGAFEELIPASIHAAKIAEQRGLDLVCTQIYGADFYGSEDCFSFMRESWSKVPDAPAWGSLPLVFDRRDTAREADVKALLMRGKNAPNGYIVTALSGKSSPFPWATQLRERIEIEARQRNMAVIDVSGFLTDRFFDLLGLLEGALSIVSIDSGVLQLAHACPKVPVVAFITRDPSPWHGTPWRPQHVARYFYDEAPDCIAEAAIAAIIGWPERRRRIFHVWSHFQKDGIDAETRRRMDVAHGTWAAEYAQGAWVATEYSQQHAWRSSGDAPIEDPRPMPFWRDMIDLAMANNPADGEIIALTNADVCFVPGLTGIVMDAVTRHGAAYTHRWDFHRPISAPLANEAEIRRGEWYPGSDAFFFSAGWWRENGHEFPDMILGREKNDEVLRLLIKRHGGVEIPGAIYHEKHPSFWEHHGQLEKNPGNQFNRALAAKWFRVTALAPNDPVWWIHPAGDVKAARNWARKNGFL